MADLADHPRENDEEIGWLGQIAESSYMQSGIERTAHHIVDHVYYFALFGNCTEYRDFIQITKEHGG